MGLLGNSLGGLFGGGEQQQSARQAEMAREIMSQQANQYNISSAYGMSPVTLTPYISTTQSSGTMNVYYDYGRDPPLTNAEWLDRRIDEIRVKL